MAITQELQLTQLVEAHKVSSSVVSIVRMVLLNLPDQVARTCTLQPTEDYGIRIAWSNGYLEIRQASVNTLFMWLTFDKAKVDQITTGEERVFTDEDTLRLWLLKHADELG